MREAQCTYWRVGWQPPQISLACCPCTNWLHSLKSHPLYSLAKLTKTLQIIISQKHDWSVSLPYLMHWKAPINASSVTALVSFFTGIPKSDRTCTSKLSLDWSVSSLESPKVILPLHPSYHWIGQFLHWNSQSDPTSTSKLSSVTGLVSFFTLPHRRVQSDLVHGHWPLTINCLTA